MALDFNNQSDQDVQRLVEDLENVIQSPISDDMGIKQEWDFYFFVESEIFTKIETDNWKGIFSVTYRNILDLEKFGFVLI